MFNHIPNVFRENRSGEEGKQGKGKFTDVATKKCIERTRCPPGSNMV